MKRNWIDNVADLISGRVFNTLVSLRKRMKAQEKKMTQNEQIILNAAQALTEAKTKLETGIDALIAKINQLEGVEVEDLSEELAALTNAVGGIGNTAGRLTPVPEPLPANPPANPADDVSTPIGGPIVHDPDAPATPLAGSSGPTDAGVPTEPIQPGTEGTGVEVPTTPVAEDATNEANPSIPADTGPTDEGTIDDEMDPDEDDPDTVDEEDEDDI